MEAKGMALALARGLDSKKGQNIKVLETTDLTSLADFFVLCTATSNTQIRALSDECERVMKENGELPHHVEGHGGGTWMLLDFSCCIVHIFSEEAREFYNLDKLWADATALDLSDVLTAD